MHVFGGQPPLNVVSCAANTIGSIKFAGPCLRVTRWISALSGFTRPLPVPVPGRAPVVSPTARKAPYVALPSGPITRPPVLSSVPSTAGLAKSAGVHGLVAQNSGLLNTAIHIVTASPFVSPEV